MEKTGKNEGLLESGAIDHGVIVVPPIQHGIFPAALASPSMGMEKRHNCVHLGRVFSCTGGRKVPEGQRIQSIKQS